MQMTVSCRIIFEAMNCDRGLAVAGRDKRSFVLLTKNPVNLVSLLIALEIYPRYLT